MGETDKGRIVNAILELRRGDWDATTGEVSNGVLVLRPTRRVRECCGEELITKTTRGMFTWELRRCGHCHRSYSIGPALPPVMISPLARNLIELYTAHQDAVAAAGER
jgi:hypothetical protein